MKPQKIKNVVSAERIGEKMSLYPLLVSLKICKPPKCKYCGGQNVYIMGFFSPNHCCRRSELDFLNKKELIELIVKLENKGL